MNITAEQLEKIEKALRFYADGKHFHWEGCHCHGSHVIDDRGETAEKGLQVINEIRYAEETEAS